MKKTVIILSAFVFISGSFGQPTKKQTETKNTVGDFVGRWKTEYIHNSEDLTDDLMNYWFELYLEKDTTKENSLKGWHCAIIRGGRQIDCMEYDEETNIHGYLKNDTVYLHFINTWDDEVEAKLYFDKSEQNLSYLIWQLDKYEPKLCSFFNRKDTLLKARL